MFAITAALLTLATPAADGTNMHLSPSGVVAKFGGYMPLRAELTSDETGIKKKPAGLTAPTYTKVTFGGKTFRVILDEPTGSPAKLYIDSNGNGDFTDDKAPTWAARKQGNFDLYMGDGSIRVDGKDIKLTAYRFDKTDPSRAALKSTLLYYTDAGYEGTITLAGKQYPILVPGDLSDTSMVWIDRNSDGKAQSSAEYFQAGKPFNIGGTTYQLKAKKGKFNVTKSATEVAEIPLPPDLSLGAQVPTFKATTMEGKEVNFPSSYKGKLVMIDFWATWCGPCIGEIPNVTKTYAAYHDKGFEILGVTLDQEKMADKVKAFTAEKGMTWPQLYEGKYWDVSQVKAWGINGIPFTLLVDGDTGKILADSRTMRGDDLEKTVSAALAKKFGTK